MFCTYFNESEVYDYKTAKKSNTAKFSKFFGKMLNRGVNLAPSQFEAGFLSLAHTQADINKTARAVYETMKEIS
jgi:glutamate-1-semialdehyde 2,1-aminomutase